MKHYLIFQTKWVVNNAPLEKLYNKEYNELIGKIWGNYNKL